MLTIIVVLGIYVYTLAIPVGKIFLTHEISDNFHVVSVNAAELKAPFFGTAFHVHYDSEDLTYDHFTLGDYFASDNSPLVLVNESDEKGKVVVGISMKRGSLIEKSDGILLKLYFKGGTSNEPDFAFSNTVFSTFENGRKDIDGVDFVADL